MAAVLSEHVLEQHGPNDHFGQNDLIPNRILAFARPKIHGPFWPEEVYFGPFRSANRTLAILTMGSEQLLDLPAMVCVVCHFGSADAPP